MLILTNLIKSSPTLWSSTETDDLLLFDGEFVVIGDLLVEGDGLFRVNDDLLFTFDSDHLGVTVWIATMIDEPGEISTLRGVDDVDQVNSEEIGTPNSLFLVLLFPNVSQIRTNRLTHVLNDHFISCDRLSREKSPVVDCASTEAEALLPEL